MLREHWTCVSEQDGLNLDAMTIRPDGEVKGIVQLSHGMVETKEYYYSFMEDLAAEGYCCVIHDHRGHGKSVKNDDDLGYMYEETSDYLVEDLHQITRIMRESIPGVPLFLFGHSMGSLIVRKYIKKYDQEIQKLIVCGSPSMNGAAPAAKGMLKLLIRRKGDHVRPEWINKLVLGPDKTGSWLSRDEKYVREYMEDPKCGYVFTANGFLNLMNLMIDVYSKEGWKVSSPKLPILFIAGQKDKIIKNKGQWEKSINFLKDRGYDNILSISYPGMRHVLLHEIGKEAVIEDIIDFLAH